jgi:hypothetical protein
VRRLLGELERGNLKIAMQMTDVEVVSRRMECLTTEKALNLSSG